MVKNNISYTITEGMAHANVYSPTGVTFDTNLFDEAVTGNAATNQVNGVPILSKTTGWRSLTSGTIDGSWWTLASGNSPAIDAGILIGGISYLDPDSVWTDNVQTKLLGD